MEKPTGWKQPDPTKSKLKCPFCGNKERSQFTPLWDESDDREIKFVLYMHCHLCARIFEKTPRWENIYDRQQRI